jgi:hypothetical protein
VKQQPLFPEPEPAKKTGFKVRDGYPVSPLVDVTAKKHKGNPESKKANLKAAPRKGGKREAIYRWFQAHGPAIAEQLLEAFPQWRYSTVTARISELRRDGFLEQIGVRSTRYSDSPAALLRCTSKTYPLSE